MKWDYWVGLGFVAQFAFFLRFLVQWLASERAKQSVIPEGFWYLSIAGSLLLLCYSVHVRDPVFILGQSTGTVIYARNLVLIKRTRRRPGAPS
jgi:lipid-A-disaccharide synthase-like uncharacterized protein